jgi:hypothetical protein
MAAAGDGSEVRSATDRADELMTGMTDTVRRFVARTLARSREEVEDMWAEAKSLRSTQASQSERREG